MNQESVIRDRTTALVRPPGDLVASRLPSLRSQLKEMVSDGVLHLTIDLVETRMVDSAGIGLLISAHNSLKKAGGELSVVRASKDILELFKTMRIHQHFSVSGN